MKQKYLYALISYLRETQWGTDGYALRNVKSHPCIVTLNGHAGIVNSCAFSADGAVLSSASDDTTVAYGIREHSRMWPLFKDMLLV